MATGSGSDLRDEEGRALALGAVVQLVPDEGEGEGGGEGEGEG